MEKALGEQFPEGERYFGLENFGNTCYCNSVLQVRRGKPPNVSLLVAMRAATPRRRRVGFVGSLPCGAVRSDACFARSEARDARAEDQR